MNNIKELLSCVDVSSIMGSDIDYIREFIYDKSLSCNEYTLEGYAERLRYVVQYFLAKDKALTTLKKADVKEFVHHLRFDCKLSPVTINGRIRILKMFYKWLNEEYDIGIDSADGIKSIPGRKKSSYEILVEPADILKILDKFEKGTFYGDRNILLTYLLYDGFLRREEVTKIKIEDISLMTGLVTVHGKGHKNRTIKMTSEVVTMMRRYTNRYSSIIKDYLICTKNGDKLTGNAIRLIYAKINKKYNLSSSPHRFRHSGIHEYLSVGGSLATASARAGHASPKITYNIYSHLVGAENIESVEKHSPARALKQLKKI